jgi:PBP1b-binding outer membrane lipoprotein LpoB
MPLRSIAALAALAFQLAGCAAAGKQSAADQDADQRRKAAIDEMERRHTETMLEMGGGGGGSM